MTTPKHPRMELSSENRYKVHFIYCGSTIIHTFVCVDQVHKDVSTLTIDSVKNVDNTAALTQFSQYINADLKRIFFILKRTAPAAHLFSHLEELDNIDTNVYIFQYRNPPKDSRSHQFSAIPLTDLMANNILQVSENTDIVSVSSLSTDHNDHYPLELFRQSSAQVNGYYTAIVASALPASKSAIEEAKRANNSLSHPPFSGSYTEREWTQRLYTGMQLHTPHLNPQITQDDAAGGGFEKKILHVWSGLDSLSATSVPFRGAPDLTYDNKIISVAVGDDDEEREVSDASTSPVEVAVAKSGTATSLSFCPEKLGELSAAMMTKAFCKFLRKSVGQDSEPLIVHGIYLNRPESEVIQCEMLMTPTLITGSRRINHKMTKLCTQQQFISSAADLCKVLHYHCHA